jgi:magnesium chelatase subunit I
VLIGTMNPEEGELRPQLLDRFGLNVALGGHTAPAERGQIIRRRLDFDSDPHGFCAEWEGQQQSLRERCQQARSTLASIALDDDALAQITERCFAAGVDGLRADLVWLRAARAHAAWRGARPSPRKISMRSPNSRCAIAVASKRHRHPNSNSPSRSTAKRRRRPGAVGRNARSGAAGRGSP